MEEINPKKKTGRKGKETEHLKALRLGCEGYSCFAYKIPDLPMKFQSPKPFDAFLSVFGVAVAVEAKFSSERGRFGLKDLSENQRNSLHKFSSSGGVSIAVLFQHIPGENPIMYYFSLSELETGQRFVCDPASRHLIVGQRVKEVRIAQNGKSRHEYRWSYDVWPFLRFCADEFSLHLARKLLEPGSGAKLGLARSFQSYLPGFVDSPLRSD